MLKSFMNYNKDNLIHDRKSFERDELLFLLEQFQFIIECLAKALPIKEMINLIFSIEEKLQFDEFEGIEKGEMIKYFKKSFIEEFSKSSRYAIKILKGKIKNEYFGALFLQII